MLGWAVAAVLACAVIAAVALYERELRGMARFLRRSDRSGNERVTVEFGTPGVSRVAAAVNAELDALRDERAAMGERQEAFQRDLASLSHDIRTPLAGAQGYLQLYGRTEDEAARARCLDEAAARLAAMRELTDRLFEYSKAADAASPLSADRVEVLPVLAAVLAGAYPQFAERGWDPAIDFADEAVCALADEEALSRVFANLVANALRHGTAAPRIEQRLEAQGRSASADATVAVTFSNRVADAGSIDADRLFERFYRADGSRSGGGSGLGLAIVASLCRRMGGSATARVDGDGLAITVRLPAAGGAAGEG